MILKKIFSFFIKILLSKLINNFLKKINFVIVFRNGSAIGDHVYMSCVLREIFFLKKKIILFTNYYDLYLNNPRIYRLFKVGKKNFIWFFLQNLKGKSILEFHSIYATKENHELKRKNFMAFHKKKHLAEAMSEHFNLNLNYNKLQNEIYFAKEEISKYENEMNLPTKFSLIQSVSKNSFTENKEWSLMGMQNIVNHFNKINWIQIGLSSEPKLDNCSNYLDLDLRGTSYLIYKCQFLVTYEGLFNHIASCFKKKNFLIHTGFLHKEAFFYPNNIVIENNKKMNCYPCYSLNCKDHRIRSQKNLTTEFVVKKIRENI